MLSRTLGTNYSGLIFTELLSTYYILGITKHTLDLEKKIIECDAEYGISIFPRFLTSHYLLMGFDAFSQNVEKDSGKECMKSISCM